MGKIFPDQAMTVAAVDRLVHHATIFEMNVESYRRRTALERKRGRGRPPVHATVAANVRSPRRSCQCRDTRFPSRSPLLSHLDRRATLVPAKVSSPNRQRSLGLGCGNCVISSTVIRRPAVRSPIFGKV